MILPNDFVSLSIRNSRAVKRIPPRNSAAPMIYVDHVYHRQAGSHFAVAKAICLPACDATRNSPARSKITVAAVGDRGNGATSSVTTQCGRRSPISRSRCAAPDFLTLPEARPPPKCRSPRPPDDIRESRISVEFARPGRSAIATVIREPRIPSQIVPERRLPRTFLEAEQPHRATGSPSPHRPPSSAIADGIRESRIPWSTLEPSGLRCAKCKARFSTLSHRFFERFARGPRRLRTCDVGRTSATRSAIKGL
jgi:hypothetical protein